jgi:hypothetical protein
MTKYILSIALVFAAFSTAEAGQPYDLRGGDAQNLVDSLQRDLRVWPYQGRRMTQISLQNFTCYGPSNVGRRYIPAYCEFNNRFAPSFQMYRVDGQDAMDFMNILSLLRIRMGGADQRSIGFSVFECINTGFGFNCHLEKK